MCDPAPPKVTHVSDYFAIGTCSFCRTQSIDSHHDLESLGRPKDGTAELVCTLSKNIKKCSQKLPVMRIGKKSSSCKFVAWMYPSRMFVVLAHLR